MIKTMKIEQLSKVSNPKEVIKKADSRTGGTPGWLVNLRSGTWTRKLLHPDSPSPHWESGASVTPPYGPPALIRPVGFFLPHIAPFTSGPGYTRAPTRTSRTPDTFPARHLHPGSIPTGPSRPRASAPAITTQIVTKNRMDYGTPQSGRPTSPPPRRPALLRPDSDCMDCPKYSSLPFGIAPALCPDSDGLVRHPALSRSCRSSRPRARSTGGTMSEPQC